MASILLKQLPALFPMETAPKDGREIWLLESHTAPNLHRGCWEHNGWWLNHNFPSTPVSWAPVANDITSPIKREVSSPLQIFDKAIQSVTQERGKDYNHPADEFASVAILKAALPEFTDQRVRHIAEMICLKLVRLSHNPGHLDSWIDIAGYARTGVMILDRESPLTGI